MFTHNGTTYYTASEWKRLKITKIYKLFTDKDFSKVPTDGSALILFWEDLYVYHEGYWKMVKSDKFVDLTKPITYDDDEQVYSVSKAKWEYLNSDS